MALPDRTHLPLSCEQLIADLSPLLDGEEVKTLPMDYFAGDGMLMREWTPPSASAADDWSAVNQIVGPAPYFTEILKLAHDWSPCRLLGCKNNISSGLV